MTKTIKIEGMMCPHCEAAVKKALEAIDGVKEASASHENARQKLCLIRTLIYPFLKKQLPMQDIR